MPSIFTRVSEYLFPTDDTVKRNREVIRKLESRKADLERRISEDLDYYSNYVDPMERYRNGDELFLPITGTVHDRKQGGSWPRLRTMQDLTMARGLARQATEGNAYGAGFLDRSVDFVVGDGMQPTVSLKGQKKGATSTGVADADGDGEPDVDPAVERVEDFLEEFRKLNDWGCGEQDREEESYRRSLQDAEILVQFFKGGANTNGVCRVRFVDPERIDEPPGMARNERWGIRTDPEDVETREAIYLKDLDDSTTGQWYPIDKFIFHKEGTPRTVKRGYPAFAIVADALAQCEKIQRNMSEVTAIQAAIAYVRQHAPGTLPAQITNLISSNGDYQTKPKNGIRGTSDRTVQVQWTDPGQVIDMSDGMNFEAGPASGGAAGFIAVLQSRLRGICARFGFPEFFTADASNNNLASAFIAGGPFERNIKRRQRRFADFQEAVYNKAIEYAVRSGRLSQADVDAVEVKVECPGVSIANKLEETQIRQIENQAGVLSPQTWMLQAGYDPGQETANKEAWDAKFSPVPATMPGANGQGGEGGGGDGGGIPNPFGESYTDTEYQLLSEADRSHLVFDRTKRRWVNPNKHKPGEKGHRTKQDLLDSRSLWAKAMADPNKLNPEEFAALADHLESLDRDTLRNLSKQLGGTIGKDRQAMADKLIAGVKAARDEDKATGAGLKKDSPKSPPSVVDNPPTVGNTTGVGSQSAAPKPEGGAMSANELPELAGDQNYVVSGDTFKHKDAIKAAGGKFQNGVWVFSGKGAKEKASQFATHDGVSVYGQSDQVRAAVLAKLDNHVGRVKDPIQAAALEKLKAFVDPLAWRDAHELTAYPASDVLNALAGKETFSNKHLLAEPVGTPFGYFLYQFKKHSQNDAVLAEVK